MEVVVEDLNALLLEQLTCPVCYEGCVPPVFMCTLGHNVCSRCQVQLHVCPVCRGSRPVHRNLMADKVSLHVRRPCRNSRSGCLEILALGEMTSHLECCTFGMECLIRVGAGTCEWRGPTSEIRDHVRSKHPDDYVECSQAGITVAVHYSSELQVNDVSLVSHEGHLFWVAINFDSTSKTLSGFSRSLDDRDACEYRCEYAISSPDGEEELRYRCSVVALNHQVCGRNTFLFCRENLKTFVQNADELTFNCKIFRRT